MTEELLDCRKFETAASRLAERVAEDAEVVQVRVWLVRKGDRCPTCAMRSVCPAQDHCLHLVSIAAGGPDPDAGAGSGGGSRTEGASPRFPLGVGMLGKVAQTGEGDSVADLRRDPSWKRAGDWIRREGIRGFVLEPMISGGGVRGVVGVFARGEADGTRLAWLRPVAEAAAAALAFSRKLGKLERLADRAVSRPPTVAGPTAPTGGPAEIRTETQMRDDERDNILRALEVARWRVYGPDGAAALLGLRPTTLASRMRKMGVRRPGRDSVGPQHGGHKNAGAGPRA